MQLEIFQELDSGIIKELGIPYMGSKRKLAYGIVDFILEENPDCKYFYDLFGGGGAVSFAALQRKQIKKVFYNELNTGVVELLRDIIKNGVTEKYYQWIDRETFQKHKNDKDWFGGLLKTCWSFGNSQRSYLYGRDIEEYKRNYHYVVVNRENKLKEMAEFAEKYVLDKFGVKERCELKMPESESYQERRLEMRAQLVVFEKKCRLQQLQRLEQLQQLQQLKGLEQLEGLQQLEGLEGLEILNLSYEEVEIKTPVSETIIYLDPPYKGTKKYEIDLCHDTLNKWIKQSQYKIYLSSYESELQCVKSWNHRCTLSAINNSKRVEERLFCNR